MTVLWFLIFIFFERELENKKFCSELFSGFNLILTSSWNEFRFVRFVLSWLTEINQLKFVVFLENPVLTQLIKNILLVWNQNVGYFILLAESLCSYPECIQSNSYTHALCFYGMFYSGYNSLPCVFGLACISTIVTSKHFNLIPYFLSGTWFRY
jgi:hypothetical protein